MSVFIGFIFLCIIAIIQRRQQHYTTHDIIIIPTSNQYNDTNNYNRTTTNRRRLWPKLISDPKTLEKIDRNSKISREDFYKYKYRDMDDNSLILPNVLFLGAQKAGSTSVRMLLCLFLSVRFILYNDCLLVSYRYIYILNVRYYASTYLFS